jgi:cardiolipin synthase A/B
MLADGKRAIVGSINLAPGSFDGRRELAIETDDPDTVLRLEETAQRDWDSSHKIDLSDAGLLLDLKKRELDPSALVLDGSAAAPAAKGRKARPNGKGVA